MGPLLNTRQPQMSGQQNIQEILDIIYTDRFYRRSVVVKIAEFTPRLLTWCLKFEWLFLKTYKISEQQITLKCCLPPILAIIMKIPKMAEIVKRQMPAPRDIPQKIPAPRAKIRMQKPQSGGEFSVQIPGGARGGGGWSWQKLITALFLWIIVYYIIPVAWEM